MRLQEWLLGKRATQSPALESHVHEGDGSAHAEPDSITDDEPNAAAHRVPQPEPDERAFASADRQPDATTKPGTYERANDVTDTDPDAAADAVAHGASNGPALALAELGAQPEPDTGAHAAPV